MTGQVRPAYITGSGMFLPGDPVDNDRIEEYLGEVGGRPSRARRRVLRSNGIETRYYARTPEGQQTHLNEELAANAVHAALAMRGLDLGDVDMLCMGTTLGDVLIPGFASMVHGRLGGRAMEVVSTGGVCAASMAALRCATNAVRAGDHAVAVSGGSELSSVMMKGVRFEGESQRAPRRGAGACDSYRYFNADFLRWMLSDGAGAVVVESGPRPDGLSLRVDLLSLRSHAGELPTCMYCGCSDPNAPVVGTTWLGLDTVSDAERAGMMVLRQDTRLLGEQIGRVVTEDLRDLVDKGRVRPSEVTWFLPHLSSYFFEEELYKRYAEQGIDIPVERWFTNLRTHGNTGAASFYIMLADAMERGLFEVGDTILAMVPESARFAVCYGLFTVVGPNTPNEMGRAA